MSAIMLQGEASKLGFEVIDIELKDAGDPQGRVVKGQHIWTQKALTPYRLISGTPEAQEAVYSLLNAETNDQLGAFTSAYGQLGLPSSYCGGECVPVSGVRSRISDLQRLNSILQAGEFSEVNPLPNGLIWSPFAVGFGFWLIASENARGFEPVLLTHSLYCFIVHEIITLAMANRPLLVCEACGRFKRPAMRRDSKFCSTRCRVAHYRNSQKAQARTKPV